MDEVYKVDDPRTLKAVSHPLRVRLLGLLRVDGPATASELGRKVDESSGSTSYHLRELAKFGFIEEDPEQRDARERRWRARHRMTSWANAEMAATPEGREAITIMRTAQIEAIVRSVAEFRDTAWSREWLEEAGMSDMIIRLTPEGVREYFRRIEELQRELEARYSDDPEAEQVFLGLSAFPRESS